MKKKTVISVYVALLLAGLGIALSGIRGHDPKDLSYWVRAAGDKDWSAEAAQNKPEAQFYLGLTMIRTNLVTMIDNIPGLCAVPLVGKRLFERVSYGIANDIPQEQLAEAYRWIKKSADRGYAPAKETEKLFIGRVAAANESGESRAPAEKSARD